MGKNNQARRAAKAKQRARQRAQEAHAGRHRDQGWHAPGSGPADQVFDDAQVADLMWATAAQTPLGRKMTSPASAFDRLRRLPERTVLAVAEGHLLDHVEVLWQHGWQPDELLRHTRLVGPSAPVTRLLELAVAVDVTRRLGQDLDPRWRRQAEAARVSHHAASEGWISRWAADEGLPGAAAHPLIAEGMRVVFELPGLDELIPPPGSRPSRPSPRTAAAASVLQRVRNLLAKAESTEFEAEAIALTAKAQEMITRHAIDAALLEGEANGSADHEPTIIRVPLDPPYADAKALLLQTVAAATRCRSVSVPALFHSSVVGLPADLAAVEVLFTSLHVQAPHAVAAAGPAAGPGARTRSQSFRSAFLLAYTHRIGERLEAINAHVFETAAADSARFLPVLHSHQEAVDDFVAQRFGDLTSGAVRGGYDASGWASGRFAADQAELFTGDLEASG